MDEKIQISRIRNSLHAGVGVLVPGDIERKLRKIRRLEARVAYRDQMANFSSLREYRRFVDAKLAGGVV